MLFHAGALWRLNEAGYLPQLERVSSVSGGSITAGVLGLAWPKLGFDDGGVARAFEAEVVEPLRRMAGKTIDFPAIALGLITPGVTIGEKIAGAYRKHLFDQRDAPGPARQAALRLQRDEPPVRRALALREAVHARLPRGRGEGAAGRPGDGRGGLLRLPAVSLAGRPEARRGRVHAGLGRAPARAVHDRGRPSRTAASTTTSASRRSGSATRRSSSRTAAAT